MREAAIGGVASLCMSMNVSRVCVRVPRVRPAAALGSRRHVCAGALRRHAQRPSTVARCSACLRMSTARVRVPRVRTAATSGSRRHECASARRRCAQQQPTARADVQCLLNVTACGRAPRVRAKQRPPTRAAPYVRKVRSADARGSSNRRRRAAAHIYETVSTVRAGAPAARPTRVLTPQSRACALLLALPAAYCAVELPSPPPPRPSR
eukprot:6099306-Pleurochrysis_carterae.AAC.2